MSENKTLNFLKGIACLAVIFIHVKFPGMFGKIIALLCQFAVPIFLMISGYYAYKRDEKVIKRRLVKMIKIFAFAFSIWTLYKVAMVILKGGNLINWFTTTFTIKSLFKMIVFCTIDYAIQLWYLIAIIETYIVWYFLVKHHKNTTRNVYTSIILLFILYIVLTTICETNGLAWYLKINFLRAMGWFLLGYSFNYIDKKKIKNLKLESLILVYLVGAFITIAPTIFNTPINFSCVGVIIFSTAIFILALKFSNKSFNKTIEYIGKNLSLNIYIFHNLIASLFRFISKKLFSFNIQNVFYFPILVLICTVLFCYIINKIFNHKKLS